MKKKHFFAIFLVIIGFGIGLYFVFNQGYFPVAIVEGKFITQRTLDKGYAASVQYYKTTAGDSIDLQGLDNLAKDIKGAVLDSLIENILITNRLTGLLGRNADEAVETKIQNLTMNVAEINEATKILYGLDFDEFTALILRPQGAREVLEDFLANQQEDIDQWLIDRRGEASVIILDRSFTWQDGRVVVDYNARVVPW